MFENKKQLYCTFKIKTKKLININWAMNNI